MLDFILIPIVWLIVSFTFVMKVKKLTDGTRLEKPAALFLGYPFVLFDWIMNWTVFSLITLELPKERYEVVTDRLKRYKRYGGSWWQMFIADTLCLIANKIDKGHCD